MTMQMAQPALPADAEAQVEHSRRLDSPYIVFPALILLLIMPLGIVFHPAWLAMLAEVGVVVMFIAIFRMMRM